ncbi:MAG: prevent-host-death protein [Candidatus Lambdaproteobacteria bacterium RIFOXYD2_FULL_50_16]|uniref:Antitoxin n=1 Tax=Candidatus Lambdaproteobacteria bacterium RIFOXYD2_FULL_50_16 TaxID=1817772 RepID=A0A1F6GEQ1_9PROT|nr:MAG: prevent-host-death protein [Candidatus Lambdaproteobacteria bacterium RIFOXYD2_FULL_50_16]
MREVSVNQFRSHLKENVEQVVANHEALRVTRRQEKAFVVISEEDWERDQETLYVLGNSDLMRQISASLLTHQQKAGYQPNAHELDEINRL